MNFWQWFFLLLIFVPLAIVYFMTIWNIFTRPEMAGWTRALWLLAVIVFPFIGTLVYLGLHGSAAGSDTGVERRAQDIKTGRAPF
jgi:hypothetical protein